MQIGQTTIFTTQHPHFEVGQLVPGKVYLYKVLAKEKADGELWKYTLEIVAD